MTLDKDSTSGSQTLVGSSYTRDQDEDSLRHMRRQRDSEMQEEIRTLRESNQEYRETNLMIRADIADLRKEFMAYVNSSQRALEAANAVASASTVGRNVVYAIVSITAAIGGLVAVSELIKKWAHP